MTEPTAEGLTEAEQEMTGAVSPWADLAIRIGTYIDGHVDSDTVAWLHDALAEVLPGWLSDYAPADRLAAVQAERDAALAALDRVKALADEYAHLQTHAYQGVVEDLRAAVEGGRS